jgi:hypothetical protein
VIYLSEGGVGCYVGVEVWNFCCYGANCMRNVFFLFVWLELLNAVLRELVNVCVCVCGVRKILKNCVKRTYLSYCRWVEV